MKTLRRNTRNRVVAGVASGIAEYFNLDPIAIRLAFALTAFAGGFGIFIYIVAWIIIPEDRFGEHIQDAEIISDEKKKNDAAQPDFKNVKHDYSNIKEEVRQHVDETLKHVAEPIKHRSGWFGYLLIFLGILFLLRLFTVYYFSVYDVLRLWPVLLIFVGISVISMKRWLKNILLFFCLAFFIWLLFNRHSVWEGSSERSYHRSVNSHSIMIHRNLLETVISREGNEAELDIDAGACTLAFSEATEKLSKIKVNGEDVWEADYTNEHKQVSRFQTESEKWINPRVDVALNKTPIWELELNIGAADVNLDLSPFKVKSIDIQSGAASIAVKIGNQHSYTKIDVETGASGIVLHIPKQADCKVVSECFLVSKNLPGFLKHEGVYRTENFGKSAQTVVVEIEGAVSDFQVVRY